MITRGSTYSLHGYYDDGGDPAMPTTPTNPTVSIINADNAIVVQATPTIVGVGHAVYTYAVPSDAVLGIWLAQWAGMVNGSATFGVEAFEVEAGSAGAWIQPSILADEKRLTDLQLPPSIDLTQLILSASELLWNWSGRRYNVRMRTARPNRLHPLCGCGYGFGWGMDSVGANLPLLNCDCASLASLELPYPVTSVSSVVVDGITLPASAYALYDRRSLVRQDGLLWPCCQNLIVPNGRPGTWSVTYTTGIAPPYSGEIACRELAVELGSALSGKPSRLPSRTRNVQRQGLSIDMSDLTYLQDGKTGIPLVDLFLMSVNPNRLQSAPAVASPDTIALSHT